MNGYIIAGFILIGVTLFWYPIYEFFDSLYWMIKCLIKGGDWKYYAENVVIGIVGAIFFVGLILLFLGLHRANKI